MPAGLHVRNAAGAAGNRNDTLVRGACDMTGESGCDLDRRDRVDLELFHPQLIVDVLQRDMVLSGNPGVEDQQINRHVRQRRRQAVDGIEIGDIERMNFDRAG